MANPIFSIDKFDGNPKPVSCNACGTPALLVKSRQTGRWFTVNQIPEGERFAGDYWLHKVNNCAKVTA